MIRGNISSLILKSILAGMLISIGCLAYLSVGGVVGAILFSFGLTCIVCSKLNLFTGMAGFWNCLSKDWKTLVIVLLFNILGCWLFGNMFFGTYDASGIVETRLSTPLLDILVRSIGTGIIMTFAVGIARAKNNFIPIIMGVPIFILCGWPHCIADAFYYSANLSLDILPIWFMTVVGNFIGCNFNKIFCVDFESV